MRLVSFILVLNLLVCRLCLTQMRKCLNGLGQIMKSEEAIARSDLTLDRITQLLETHLALSTPRRHLEANVKTYALYPRQNMCAESPRHKRSQLHRCSRSDCQSPVGELRRTVATGIRITVTADEIGHWQSTTCAKNALYLKVALRSSALPIPRNCAPA